MDKPALPIKNCSHALYYGSLHWAQKMRKPVQCSYPFAVRLAASEELATGSRLDSTTDPRIVVLRGHGPPEAANRQSSSLLQHRIRCVCVCDSMGPCVSA